MELNYRLNAGQYVLHDDDKPVGYVMDSVALALDKSCGLLHKHGDPELVRQWHTHAQAKLRNGGFTELADDLVVMEGRFLPEDLNRCVSTTGYAGKLYQQFLAGTLAALPLIP